MRFASLLLAFSPATLLADQPIGHVIKWQGTWIDQLTGSRVEKGLSIFRDSKLVLKGKADPHYSITIRSYINSREAVYSCDTHPCTEPLALRETLRENPNQQKSGFFQALVQVIR